MGSLRHVLWIGGPSGAGKTTIATRLARRHGLRWYNADTRTWQHRDRALEDGHPAARRWEALSPEERWNDVTDDELFAMSLHRERAAMVVDDLHRLPCSPLIIAEGSVISPEVVSTGAADRALAVWLLPTPELSRRRHRERGTPSGPARLHRLVSADLERQAAEHGVQTVGVDGMYDVRATVELVEELFASALRAGPLAGSPVERRDLLREANEAIVEQVRGYYDRPWADGTAESVLRTFLCECGDPICESDVEIAVGAAAGGPVLAAGHERRM